MYSLSAFVVLFMLAGTGGAIAPEPTRTFVTSSVRAGVTVGAMTWVVGASAPMPAPPPPAPPHHSP